MIILGSLELFSLGVKAEALRAKIDRKSAISLQRGQLDPKFQIEGADPINHSSSRKTRPNDLSYGIKIWTNISSVLSQCMRLTDGRTDRQNSHR